MFVTLLTNVHIYWLLLLNSYKRSFYRMHRKLTLLHKFTYTFIRSLFQSVLFSKYLDNISRFAMKTHTDAIDRHLILAEIRHDRQPEKSV